MSINIIEKGHCSGCHACTNACPKKCISMVSDEEGFWYPKVNKNKCVECNICEKLCPIIRKTIHLKKEIKEQLYKDQKAYACFYNNEDIRQSSSSGGLFTVIAESVINAGGVVFGAEFNEYFNVVHGYVENKADLCKLRGSKYVQSKIDDNYKEAECFLKQERQVLFTGTPCQVAGLKSYLRKEYKNLLCIDVICHGVPSPMIWQKYLTLRQKQESSKMKTAFFRSKKNGWKKFSLSLLFENGKEYIKSISVDLYLVGFQKNLYLRPSCYSCSFKTQMRDSDITLADCWGIQNIVPELDDDKGTSLVVVNSDKGQKIFDMVQSKLNFKQVDFKQAISYQPAYLNSMPVNPQRKIFFDRVGHEDIDYLIRKNCKDETIVVIKMKLKCLAKKILKMLGLFGYS